MVKQRKVLCAERDKMVNMNDIDFKELVENTIVFKKFENFKKALTLKLKNIIRLKDLYEQAKRYGVDYLKQNPHLSSTDVKIIQNIIENEHKI